MQNQIAVIGGGSWGTALSQVASYNMDKVLIYARDREVVKSINNDCKNNKYFADIKLNNNIAATSDLERIIDFSKDIILSVPTNSTRSLMEKISKYLCEHHTIISTAKGIETASFKTNSEVIREFFAGNVVVLSGPTHAEEVIRQIPTAIVTAAKNRKTAIQIQNMLMTPRFRIYTLLDIKGVEIAGAIKNIIAVASGITDGIGYGDNTKAALITRGLAEIVKFGLAQNTDRKTYNGLAGLGDLVVTCNSEHSRNRRFGIQIGKGASIKKAAKVVNQIVEGVKTVQAVHDYLLNNKELKMPITQEVYKVLYENKEPIQAVDDLMSREAKDEFYYLS